MPFVTPVSRESLSRGRNRQSIPALKARAQELELLQRETGAPAIEQDSPGVFSRIIDVLSRPNFAIAGFAEELAQGNGVLNAAERALTETFSGLGPLQGKKRAFGQVLEGLGVGTVTLAQAIPYLEGTWVGHLGLRGAVGIGLDIATDPLTYFTGGTKAVQTLSRMKGLAKVPLNAKGALELDSIRKTLLPLKDEITKGARSGSEAIELFEEAAEKRFRRKFAFDIPDEFVDPGGIKWMGRSIVRGETFSRMNKNIVGAMRSIPGGSTALDATAEFGNATRKVVNGLFHPNNELGNLPPEFMDDAVRLRENFMNTKLSLSGRIRSVIKHGGTASTGKNIGENLAKRYQKLAKADPEIGRKMYEVMYKKGTSLSDLSDEAQEVYSGFSNLMESMGADLVKFDVFDAGELRNGAYFPSRYKNTKEVIEQYHFARDGAMRGKIKESMQKQRVFDDPFEAETVSGLLEDLSKAQIGQGKAARFYGKLDPDFDLLGNVNSYIEQWSEAIARQGWQEQIVKQFGKKIDDFDLNAIYDALKPFEVGDADAGRISLWFGGGGAGAGRGAREVVFDPIGGMGAIPEQAKIADSGFVVSMKPSEYIGLRPEGRPRDFTRQKVKAIEGRIEDGAAVANPVLWLRWKKDHWIVSGGEGHHRSKAIRSVRGDTPIDVHVLPENIDILSITPEMRKAPIAGDRRVNTTFVPSDSVAPPARASTGSKFRDLVDQEQMRGVLDSGGERLAKIDKGQATAKVMISASKQMEKLSGDGKREFVRRLIESSNSSSQLTSILNGLHGKYSDFFPTFRAIREGEKAVGYKDLFKGVDAEYIPVKSAFTGDNGAIIPKIIWEDMQKVNTGILNSKDYPAFAKLLRGFDFTNNMFKLGVYTFWPASALRDAYSNVALSMLDIGLGALNPKYHMDTVGIMAGRKGVLKTKGGVRYQWDDLKEMAHEFGVWVPGEVFAELTGDVAKLGTTAGKIQRGVSKAARVRGLIENEARMQLWIQNIRRGVDPRQAADHVSEFLFNYGALNQFEREFMRRAIPFYTFTRKNIQLQAKALRRSPGLVINEVKPFRQREDEKEMMVKWEAESLGIRLNRDGKTVHAIQGIDLPIRNLDTLWAGGFGATGRRLMGMLTPVVKTPIEAIAGRDFFTGGDLKRSHGPTMGRALDNNFTPKAIKDWLGYKKEVDAAGRPSYTFDGVRYALLVKSWAFSRLISTSDRQFREYLDDSNISGSLLDLATGLRQKDMNLDEQQERKLRRRIKQLEESLVRRGKMETFTRGFQPNESRQRRTTF